MMIISDSLFNIDLLRAYTHHIVEKILNEFNNKSTQRNYTKKLILMSGEETSIVAILNVLRATSYECMSKLLKNRFKNVNCAPPPDPASSIMIELLKSSKGYSVRILYNGSEIRACPLAKK